MGDARSIPLAPGSRFPDWKRLYETEKVESLPWYHPALDPDLLRDLSRVGPRGGRFLDIGSGPGNQAHELHRLGFEVVGIDLAEAAVESASKAFPNVRFLQDDILHSRLTETFDYAFDRGCFHIFAPEMRERYIDTVARLLVPGGILWLKVFSQDEAEAGFGPYRYSEEELRRLFGKRFTMELVVPTVYQGTLERHPKALFARLRRD